MDIAIDVRSLMEGRASGVEQYTIQIIRGMARVAPGHHYHLFYNAAERVVLPDFYGQVRVHAFRYPNVLFTASQWLLNTPAWDSLVKADVFFVPNSRLVPLTSRGRMVVVAHDLSFERFPEFFDSRRRVWHRLMSPRHLMRSADAVVAVSEHTKRDVTRLYGLSPEKISVIHSGVEVPPIPPVLEQAALRRRYHVPDRFVLYVGALEPRKNIATLVRAFDAIAGEVPHDLVIAGERGWRGGELLAALRHTAHRERIHVLGFVREPDKAALYAAADVFVYPSFYEGFGFPPLEALALGTPVITSFNSSLPEVVGEWATLVDPYNGGELAAAMKELLLDIPVVSEKTRQEIRQRYSWEQTARETLRILEDVAK